MLSLFEHLLFWYWFLFAAILLIAELISGSGFLFWIGISSVIVGCLVWLFPDISSMVQLLGFAVLAILAAVFWWLYLKRYPSKTDRPVLNRRAEQYIGRVFTLETPIVNGLGKIHVDDSSWRVHCDKDLPEGARIHIIGVDGVILIAAKGKD